MPRFDDLLRHINDQATDNEGEAGYWIKATKHSEIYNDENPGHTDIRGGNWWGELQPHIQAGDILKYRIPPSTDVYYVLPNPDAINHFLDQHPDAGQVD